MAKVSKQATKKSSIKRLVFPNDEPIHIPFSFEEAIKMAVNINLSRKGKRKINLFPIN